MPYKRKTTRSSKSRVVAAQETSQTPTASLRSQPKNTETHSSHTETVQHTPPSQTSTDSSSIIDSLRQERGPKSTTNKRKLGAKEIMGEPAPKRLHSSDPNSSHCDHQTPLNKASKGICTHEGHTRSMSSSHETYGWPSEVPPSYQLSPGSSETNVISSNLPSEGQGSSPSKRQRRSVKGKEKEAEEKRAARFKPKCPGNILERVERVTQQRFFMIDREKSEEELQEKFSVLGSTGNVYTIRIQQIPSCNCPDASKGNHCKHILFILLKVLHVPRDSHYWYQKALLTSELEEIFTNAPNAPSAVPRAAASVTAAYHRAIGKPTTIPESESGPRRMPGPDDDCPICYETMHSEDPAKLVFCESCGNGVHGECFMQWARSMAGKGQKLTCVWCRATWALLSNDEGNSAKVSRDGYLNLAEMAGVSSVRDTSTYHYPRRYRDDYYSYEKWF